MTQLDSILEAGKDLFELAWIVNNFDEANSKTKQVVFINLHIDSKEQVIDASISTTENVLDNFLCTNYTKLEKEFEYTAKIANLAIAATVHPDDFTGHEEIDWEEQNMLCDTLHYIKENQSSLSKAIEIIGAQFHIIHQNISLIKNTSK